MPYDYKKLMVELARVGAIIPYCYFVSVENIDGLTVGRWVSESRKDDAVFDRSGYEPVTIMSMTTLSTAYRVTTEFVAGKYQFLVMAGANSTLIQMAITEDAVQFFGVTEVESIDRILVIVRREWDELHKLLDSR